MAYNQHLPEGSDLPEVIPNGATRFSASSNFPENVPPNVAELSYDGTQGIPMTGQPQSNGTTPELGLEAGKSITSHGLGPQKRNSFWTKKRIWIAVGVGMGAVLAIGLGSGLGISLGRSKQDEEADTGFGTPITLTPAGADGSDSVCSTGWCAWMLATVSLSSDPSKFMLVGRNSDNKACYRDYDGNGWDQDDWTCLDGRLQSQLAAVVQDQGIIQVFGVEQESLRMRMRTRHGGGVFEPHWGDLSGGCYSPPSACSPEPGALLLLMASSEAEIAWKRYDDGQWDPAMEAGWKRWGVRRLGSSPVAVCMGPGKLHSVAYGNRDLLSSGPFELMIKRGNSTAWDDWQYVGGEFQGDPAIAVMSETRLDFVGVGKDGDMYHGTWVDLDNTWELADSSAQPQNIGGGKFVSTAGLLVTGEDRLDAVAVGSDGRLRHRALRGSEWRNDWEDLGGFFNSAPHVRRLSDTKVVVFGIGPGNEVIHGEFETSDSNSWGKGKWYSDKGSMSTNGHRGGIS